MVYFETPTSKVLQIFLKYFKMIDDKNTFIKFIHTNFLGRLCRRYVYERFTINLYTEN